MNNRCINKKEHNKLIELLSANNLYGYLSERAIKILSVNYVTLNEFLSFKYSDYRKLRWADKDSLYELLAIAKEVQNMENGSGIKPSQKAVAIGNKGDGKNSLHGARKSSIDIFLTEYRIENVISGRAYRALKMNHITRSKFFSMSLADFKDLKEVGKKIAEELYSIAEKYREEENAKIINDELEKLIDNIVCANDSELSDILQPVSGNIYVERFSKIFHVLCSLFEKIVTAEGNEEDFKPVRLSQSVYSYLCSIRQKQNLFVCKDAGIHFLHERKSYQNCRLNKREEELLSYFDEAFLKSCISCIGHGSTDEAFMNQVIVDVMNDLQDKYGIFNLLSPDSKLILYKLKHGDMSVFTHYNLHRIYSRLSQREYRFLCKIVIWNKTTEEIGEEEGITRNRVTQIYNQVKDNIRSWGQKDGTMSAFRSYKYDELAYITPYNTNFEKIKESEPIDYDFDFFCFLISIFYDDFVLFSRRKISQGKTEKITYLCNKKLIKAIDIDGIQKYIQRNYNDPLITEITLNPILAKRTFRLVDNVSSETINDAKGILTYICQECYDLKVIDAEELFADVSVFLTPEKIKAIIVDILMQNKAPMSSDLILNALVTINPKAYKNLSIDKVKSFLSDKKTFKQVGLKSLYTLASSSNYVNSVTKSIGKTLCESKEPIKMQELIQKVLLLRPDSNERSVRSFITSMIKRNECTLYKDTYVGLTSRIDEYPSKYEPDESVSKQSFGERIQTLFDFVEKYQRMPNMQGDAREKSLAAWYRRINADPDLSVGKLVLIDRVEQICRENHYPKDANECDFRDNSEQVKAIIMRTGKLPQMQEDKALYEWLFRTSKREQNLSGFYKEEYAALKQFMSDFNLG